MIARSKTTAGCVWRIQGFDGPNVTFETVLPIGYLNEQGMERLLQRLASRHLGEQEIVDASIRKGSPNHRPLLAVSKEAGQGARMALTVGGNPHYMASVWDRADLERSQGAPTE